MDDQQFCLKWNNHQSTLISVFDSMLQRNLLVDCTLAAEGRTLKAHKVVLSACSPYFENVLTDHYDKHPIVILKDVKYQELEAMMDYMYRGEVNVSQDQLGSLLKTAESLQIKGLSDNRKSSGEDDSHRKRDPPPIKRDRSPEQTLVRNALESKKQEVDADSLSREGSQSPGPRKRKRLRHRTSQDNLDSGVVVLDNHDGTSNASSTHSNLNASSVPAASTSTVPEQETPLRVSSDPSSSKPISRSTPLASSVPQVPVIKEKLEPHSEIMIEPKSEYVEEELNDDNVEDLTVTLDDDDMDMDHSRPGPSHGTDGSNQGFGSWHMTDTSQDETFIAAQDAVGQHRDAQGAEFIDNKNYEPVETEWSSLRELDFIPPGAPLPPFTIILKKKIIENGITCNNLKYFIAHWGSYLYNRTNGQPSKKDYYNLASSIVEAHPTLQGGQNGCGIIQSQLSVWVRNRRRNLKNSQDKERIKQDHKGNPALFVNQTVVVPTESAEAIAFNLQYALKELEKEYHEGMNVSHIKKLLKTTLNYRRPWIENEANRITDIIKKYPPLKHYEMVFFEFLNLKNMTETIVLDKIKLMIHKLMKYFSIEENNECSKIEAMIKLYNELLNKKLLAKKKITPLFVTKEVMSSTISLTSDEGEAPCAVIYTSENKISCAYIVADENIKMEIHNPSIEKIIVGLLSSYFVWHRDYPLVYSNILLYIEKEVLGTKINNKNITVMKFIQKLKNCLEIS